MKPSQTRLSNPTPTIEKNMQGHYLVVKHQRVKITAVLMDALVFHFPTQLVITPCLRIALEVREQWVVWRGRESSKVSGWDTIIISETKSLIHIC